ncbi:TPA: hypothetical protein NJ057_004875 [Vibrio parahaemolyticus]|nr:hypothetical protein [Vibrio parahaemolyticus]HCG9001565.1 hypothetical protein [Vibrio parahaemolyticus]
MFKALFNRSTRKMIFVGWYCLFIRKKENQKFFPLLVAARYHGMYLSNARDLYPKYGSMLHMHRPVHRFSLHLKERFPNINGMKLHEYHKLNRTHVDKEIPKASLQPMLIFVSLATAITQAFSTPLAKALNMGNEDFQLLAFDLSMAAFIILFVMGLFKFITYKMIRGRLDRELFMDSVYLYLTFLVQE